MGYVNGSKRARLDQVNLLNVKPSPKKKNKNTNSTGSTEVMESKEGNGGGCAATSTGPDKGKQGKDDDNGQLNIIRSLTTNTGTITMNTNIVLNTGNVAEVIASLMAPKNGN